MVVTAQEWLYSSLSSPLAYLCGVILSCSELVIGIIFRLLAALVLVAPFYHDLVLDGICIFLYQVYDASCLVRRNLSNNSSHHRKNDSSDTSS